MANFKSILLSISLIVFLVAQSKAQSTDPTQPRYNSLLWEITGNKLTKPSYLYGTMHVSKKVAFHLTDTFFVAINRVNAIALEEDPGTWMEDMFNSQYFSERSEEMLRRMYGNFYKSAFKIDLPTNKDLAQTLSYEPNFINGLMYRFYSREGNFEENTYLDLFIYQSARKIGKPVIGLETFEQGQESIILASMPDSDKTAYDDYHYSRKDFSEDVENAYRKGDLDLLDSLSRISLRSKNTQKYLTDERNKLFVQRMDSIMQSGTSLFTGVGAAHLPGDNGVINMLRSKGYNVRAVTFTQSSKADKEKIRIENTFGPVTYAPQTFPDSSVSYMAPGKLYKLIGGSNSLFIYPDMTNGSYYSILAMNRFESFTGQNIEYTLQRIDSLLYESIPGKIISKKVKTTPEGYPTIDITNKTRRGDVARSKIVITPEYIYFFNMSGTGEYALERQHDKYFNSISVANISKENNWKRIHGDAGGFSLEMPGEVFSDVKSDDKMSTSDAFIHSFDKKDSSFYLFMRSNYPDYDYLEEDSFELSQLAEEFADQVEFTVENKKFSHDDIGLGGMHPALTATLKKDSTKYFIRILIDGPHYNLLCCKPGNKDQHDRYLSSFKLEPMQYREAFEELSDTSMHFRVNTFHEEAQSLSSRYENLYRKFDHSEDAFDYGRDETRTRLFNSPLTNEYIKLTYKKFNVFYQSKDRDKFWKSQLEDINEDTSMIISSKKIFQKDSMDVMTFTLTDTACTRGIYCKMILKKDALYTLCTTIDTLVPRGNWVTTFYDTFTPNDTAKSESVFDSKVNKFFEYLNSTDSLKNKTARKFFWRVRFDSTDVPRLIAFINDTMVSKYPALVKTNVINEIGTLKSPRSVPFLRELYAKSEDSSNVQLAILEALAERKTLEGTTAFRELITTNTPLSSDESDIESLFDNYYDTLELAAKLYPDLLKLTSYPEYKEGVYRLLAAATVNKKINAAEDKAYLSNILHDANDELKREFTSGESKSNDDNDDNDYGDYSYSNGMHSIYRSGGEKDAEENLYKANSATEDFAILLMKYYPTENGVRNYFTKLQKLKDKEMVMRTQVMMLHDSLPVADTTWKSYSSSKELRAKFYAELKRFNRLDKFDSTHKNQMDITESLLFDDLTDKDSIQFMEKRFLQTRYHNGYVYFYKYKKEKSSKWKIGYNYIQPEDISKVDIEARSLFEEIKEQMKLPKQIDKICKKLALVDRKRAGTERNRGYDDSEYEY
jgi:uncharacterized protein YbaP (TraB family)